MFLYQYDVHWKAQPDTLSTLFTCILFHTVYLLFEVEKKMKFSHIFDSERLNSNANKMCQFILNCCHTAEIKKWKRATSTKQMAQRQTAKSKQTFDPADIHFIVYISVFLFSSLNHSSPLLLPLFFWSAASVQESENDQRENGQHKETHDNDTTQSPWLLVHSRQEPFHPVLRWTCGFLLLWHTAQTWHEKFK